MSVCRHIGLRVFVHSCIINLFSCCCRAIKLHVHICTDESSAPSVRAMHAVLAEEDHSCNSRTLGVLVYCAACYSFSSWLSRSCSCLLFALVSCLETTDLAFWKRTINMVFVVLTLQTFYRDKFLLRPHIFSSSLPSQLLIRLCMCVCLRIYLYM